MWVKWYSTKSQMFSKHLTNILSLMECWPGRAPYFSNRLQFLFRRDSFCFQRLQWNIDQRKKIREIMPPKLNPIYYDSGFQSPLAEKSKTNLIISIPCDLFLQPTDTNDPTNNCLPLIVFYRMIVATGSSSNIRVEDLQSHSELMNRNSDLVYYASDKIEETFCKSASRRARRSTVNAIKSWNFTVGSGSGKDCTLSQNFCNPSLKAGHKYSIFIRAFADEGTYQDIKLGQYRTVIASIF